MHVNDYYIQTSYLLNDDVLWNETVNYFLKTSVFEQITHNLQQSQQNSIVSSAPVYDVAQQISMITSSNGGISASMAICGLDAELWCFLWSTPEQTVLNNRDAGGLKTIALIMTLLYCLEYTDKHNIKLSRPMKI